MTLEEIYEIIKALAFKQPNVHQFVDEFEYLNREDTKYSAVICQQQEHNVFEDRITYNFYIGYADRLNDKKNNKIQIQSIGIQLINNIVNSLLNNEDLDLVTIGRIIPVTQKFSAECACVYGLLSITVPMYRCEILY